MWKTSSVLTPILLTIMNQMNAVPNEADTESVRRAIEMSHRTYIAAMKRGDASALASHFTEDAILLPQNADMQRGRAAIENWFSTWLPMTTIYEFEVTTDNVIVVENTAYEVGTYRMKLAAQGAEPTSNQGKHLMVWKREGDGQWRILRDMFNTNPSPPVK